MKISQFTIRTSDRRLFRRCLRKWGFLSSLRMNLEYAGSEQNIHFWFGSGIHFALEDYHGYNRFGDPRRAFKAYFEVFDDDELPNGAYEYYDLGISMLTYYLDWYPRHNKDLQLETVWLDDNMQQVPPNTPGAHPAVEQQFFLDLGLKVIVDSKTGKILAEYTPETEANIYKTKVMFALNEDEEYEYYYKTPNTETYVPVQIVPIRYHGTFDRIVQDKYGRWWIIDYKTAKNADTNKLVLDDQVSAYLWAASQWFNHPIYGFIYLQMTKDTVKPPRRLKNGTLSVDKKQRTTYALLRKEIIKDYGSVQNAPNKLIEFLNYLAEQETPEGDRFIRWDFIKRSENQIISTYNHIIAESKMMINPDLYLFPNPTRDCIWDCPLRDICIAIEEGRHEETEFMLKSSFVERPHKEDNEEPEWRTRIKWPTEPLPPATEDEFKLELKEFDISQWSTPKYLEDYDI